VTEELRQGALAVIQARSRNRTALERLYEDNLGKAASLASAFAVSAWEASDYRNAARDGLDNAIDHYCLSSTNRSGEFSTFMFRVAQNRLKDVLRRKKRHEKVLSTRDIDVVDSSASYEHVGEIGSIEIQSWLESLSPIENFVAVRLLKGVPRTEIKKAMPPGWSFKSVMARVQKSAANSFHLVETGCIHGLPNSQT